MYSSIYVIYVNYNHYDNSNFYHFYKDIIHTTIVSNIRD